MAPVQWKSLSNGKNLASRFRTPLRGGLSATAFRYLRPSTIADVLSVLAERGEAAKVLAGGQSLMPMISLGLASPDVIVDINRLTDADDVRLDGGEVSIGPLVRHVALQRAPQDLASAAPLLPLAAPWIGHEAIRNRGTFLGSLAHGDPSAEWPAAALAVDAKMRLQSERGERWVAASDFFLGPLMTDVKEDELLVECRWQRAPERTGASVMELAFRHGDYAVVGVAAQITVDGGGTIEEARLALFGVGATPIRPIGAEQLLVGAKDHRAIKEAAAEAAESCDPRSDPTASGAYRKEMVAVYCRRALEEAHARAREA